MVVGKLALLGLGAVGGAGYAKHLNVRKALPTNKIPITRGDKVRTAVVIGGGVAGVSTAFQLAKKGFSVVVIESRSKVGAECSRCAAGGMTRSNPQVNWEKWVSVSKQIFPRISSLVFGGETPSFQFFQISWLKTMTDPHFLRWATSFSLCSLFPNQQVKEQQDEMLKFTDYAIEEMKTMLESDKGEFGSKCGYNSNGAMSLIYAKPDTPVKVSPRPNSLEPDRLIQGDNIYEEEPSLKFLSKKPDAVRYDYEAISADAERFTQALSQKCLDDPNLDVQFIYDTKIKAVDLDTTGDVPSIANLLTDKGVIEIANDTQVVVATGAWTPHIFSMIGLYAPIYPLKGYCIPFSAPKHLSSNEIPSRIVTNGIIYNTLLGDQVRTTSVGEFSGWSTEPDSDVDKRFRNAVTEFMPQLKNEIMSHPTRCGLRPYVSDGAVLLGRVEQVSNLLINCGPGSNGWKIALGAGEVVARSAANENIDDGFSFNSSYLSPKGRIKNAPIFSKVSLARWSYGT